MLWDFFYRSHSCSPAQSRLNAHLGARPPFRPPRRCLLPALRIGNPNFMFMVNTFELQESRWNKREQGTSLKESFCAISPLFDRLPGDVKINKSNPQLDSLIQTKNISSHSQDQTIHRKNVRKALLTVE